MQEEYGYITHEGKDIYLTQDPYISDCGTFYKSHAAWIDANEVTWEYVITWKVTADNPDELPDESEMCDWDDFNIEALGEKL